MVATESNAINAATTGIVGNTGTAFTGTAVTQYNVLVGGSTSSTLGNVAPSATSGVPLISQGNASNPAFGTAVVAGGGTGVVTMTTAYAPVCAGTTATGALQVASTGLSNSGYVLTSTGASSLPSWQAAGASSITLTGDTGGGLTGNSFTFNANSNCGSSVLFAGSGTTLSLKVTDASGNTLIGSTAGNGSITGNKNVSLGTGTLKALTNGVGSTAVGYEALTAATGSSNTALGYEAGLNLVGGTTNVLLGYEAGINYTGSESSNIMIGNFGTLSESNVIRIGIQGSGTGQQSTCYIAGIEGVSVSNKNYVTINTSTGQLGSEASTSLFSINVQTFTSTGTYTPTSGMDYCIIECIGGGGGGGGVASASASTGNAGGGGGGGAYSRKFASASTIGASQTVTIGAAGNAGSSGNNPGGNGGATSVGIICTANGGTGGNGAAAGGSATGGAGGTAGTGDFSVPGQAGWTTQPLTGTIQAQGAGGSSHLGFGGAAILATAAGTAGSNYGGGGSGGSSFNAGGAQAGGAGNKGIVIVTEYIIT